MTKKFNIIKADELLEGTGGNGRVKISGIKKAPRKRGCILGLASP